MDEATTIADLVSRVAVFAKAEGQLLHPKLVDLVFEWHALEPVDMAVGRFSNLERHQQISLLKQTCRRFKKSIKLWSATPSGAPPLNPLTRLRIVTAQEIVSAGEMLLRLWLGPRGENRSSSLPRDAQ
jgi:hypothetical protein